MAEHAHGAMWDAIRSWADAAGLTLAQPDPDATASRPPVPEAVCANCPICQGAATLEQLNPAIVADLTAMARSLIGGVGSALAAAAEQRVHPQGGDQGGGESRVQPTAQDPDDGTAQAPSAPAA